MAETNFNEKLLQGPGTVFSKRVPGRRRQNNIFLTKHQMRLLSGILSDVKNNLEWNDEVEAWGYLVGEGCFLGDREKKAIKVVLKRLYRCIDGTYEKRKR